MDKDKKIEEMLLKRARESFEKTKELKIRAYERDLRSVYNDLHDIDNDYRQLMDFAKEFGLTDYFQNELNRIQNQMSQQAKVAAKTVEAIQETKEEQFTPEMVLQQYAFRHEAELKTPRTVMTDYEEVSIRQFNQICGALAKQQEKSLFEEMYDGVEGLKEINNNVDSFNRQQEKDFSAPHIGEKNKKELSETRSKGLLSSARATQRLFMVKDMNRVLDKIDLLNEQQEMIMQADMPQKDKQMFIDTAKDTVRDLKSQYEKLQIQYESSIQISKREVIMDFSPDITETCLDNLINEAVHRHEELCKEAEQKEPEKEKNFIIR